MGPVAGIVGGAVAGGGGGGILGIASKVLEKVKGGGDKKEGGSPMGALSSVLGGVLGG